MKLKTPYAELMPMLSDAQRFALKQRIKSEGGIHDPVLITEDGVVLDGHNRLDFNPSANTKVIEGSGKWGDLRRQAFIYRANDGRRNLGPDQRKEFQRRKIKIAKGLKADGHKQAEIAQMFGVTREAVKKWLDPKCHIGTSTNASPDPPIDCREKINPKSRPAVAKMARDRGIKETAAEVGVSERQVIRIAKGEEKDATKKSDRETAVAKLGGDVLGIHHGDFRDLGLSVEDDTIDLIFTDPPYDKEAASMYEDVAEFAARVLRPGGWCLAYSGQAFLPDVLAGMAKHLNYAWTFACYHSGGDLRFRKYRLQNKWKPIIGFYKPKLDVWWSWFPDLTSGGREKGDHEWQQAQSEAEHFVRALCPEKGIVCDPFCGSGTTCAAAKSLGREWMGFEKEIEHVETARVRLA